MTDYCWYTEQEDNPRAERFVASVVITEINDAENSFNYLYDGLEREPVVSAVYTVVMTDARWVDWVRPGMAWATVAYPPDAEWIGRKQWREELDRRLAEMVAQEQSGPTSDAAPGTSPTDG